MKKTIFLVTISVMSVASAQTSGGLSRSISDGVNGFSSFLNGTSSNPSSLRSFNDAGALQLQSGTRVSSGDSGAPVNLSSVLEESAADCDDIKNRMQKRMEEANQSIMPDSNPGEATSEMGLDEVMNMPVSINAPAEALADVGKKAITRMVVNKASTFFNSQMNKMQGTLRLLNGKVNQVRALNNGNNGNNGNY